ncbi:MAG: RnfABCDGE type electron transport complex subunit D [bacterium]|nr:RnfABCDGE type electron transport complex subunit D [bacterium]
MKLVVSSSPHWHVKLTEGKIHLDFILALLPAVIFAVYMYGIDSARVIALSISTAVISEILIRKLFKKESTFTDGSAFLIGLLFALLLPPGIPFWVVITGSFLCIFIGKELFGGLGSSPLNPVLVGWAIAQISWPRYFDLNMGAVNYELGFDFHYPLTMLKKGGLQAIADFNLLDLLLGRQVGGLGAAGILFLFIGGAYLLLRGRITWETPASFAVGVVLMAGIFWAANPAVYANPLFHLFTGNVMIGIFFLSTDYSSSPFRRWGMVVFGLGCGFLVVIFRAWSIYPDGVVFAILIMSLFTPLLDRLKSKPKFIKVSYIEKGQR